MPTSNHPSDGTLQAYLDGELDARLTVRCAVHLRRCPSCRRAIGHLRDDSERVAALLGTIGNLGGVASRTRRRRLPYIGASVGVAAAGLLSFVLLHHPTSSHSRVAAGERVQDVCCFNLDGGTRRDDGMLTVSRAGQVVDCVVLYEDQAGRGAFVPGDPLRYISQSTACGPDLIGRSGS
jgi:Putative zinc-finger